MKVKVTVTIDIDPEAWASNFGICSDNKAAIREDVQTYFATTVNEQADIIGVRKVAA